MVDLARKAALLNQLRDQYHAHTRELLRGHEGKSLEWVKIRKRRLESLATRINRLELSLRRLRPESTR